MSAEPSSKISELPAVVAANLLDTDYLAGVLNGITSRVALTDLRTKIGVAVPSGRNSTSQQYIANGAEFNALDFAVPGTVINTDTNDAYPAITAAIAAATAAGGGDVVLPAGVYKALTPIVLPRWVRLVGKNASIVAGGTTYNGVTVIRGVHTGVAIVDMRGTQGAAIKDIKLYGDAGTTPKTGLLLGRNSAGSAGCHQFDNLSVEGYFTKAAIYSIASEENKYFSPFISLLGGGAKYCFYTSQGDDLAVGGLTGSSNIQGAFYSAEFINHVNDATASVVYINAGASTFGWSFFGGYLIPIAGAYVTIGTGAVDGANSPGPYTFIGVSGEKVPGGLNPISGFDLKTAGAFTLRGLQVIGCKFELDAAGFFLRQAAALILADIFVKTMNGMGVGSSLIPAQITNSQIDSGNATINQFYGDIDTADNSVIGPSNNTKGFQFGAGGSRFRWQNAVSQVQLVTSSGAAFTDLAAKVFYVAGSTPIFSGTGSPETVVTAPVGSIFLRTDAATTLYVKQTGAGNTGWVAK